MTMVAQTVIDDCSLCLTIPAFEAFMARWEEIADEIPETKEVITAGLDKLRTYQNRTNDVPAYVVAMGECDLILAHLTTELL
jgi:hypothetical protein